MEDLKQKTEQLKLLDTAKKEGSENIPDKLVAQLEEAKYLFDERKFEESLQICEEILTENSNYTEAFRFKCKALLGLGEYSKLNQVANKAAKTNPDGKYVIYYQGVSLYEMSKYNESLPYFERAIQLYPDWDFPYNGYGRSLDALGRNEEAIENYQKSFDLDPTDPGPLNLIANNLRWQSRKQEALEYYNKVLEIEPDHILTRCNRGEVLRSLGFEKEALDDFKFVQSLVKGEKLDPRLNPGNMEFINDALKAISELEHLESQYED